MAYDGNKLSIIAATIEGVFNTGVLIGTDTINTVLTANYISDGQKRGLPLGCTVWYFDGTDVFDCFVSAVEAAPGFGVTLSEIGAGSTFDLTITDGTHVVANVNHILFVGPVVSGTSPNGVVTISAGAAGIIPEGGPTPIKISAFPNAPLPMGAVDLLTGLQDDGSGAANYNFSQLQVLTGRDGPTSGDAGANIGLYSGSGFPGDGNGGNLYLLAGSASGSPPHGGILAAQGGMGGPTGNYYGGKLLLQGGNRATGNTVLSAGTANDGYGHELLLTGGTGPSAFGTGGDLVAISGPGTYRSGDVHINTPNEVLGLYGSPGSINIVAGSKFLAGGGGVTISAGQSLGVYVPNNLLVLGGTANASRGGYVFVQAGDGGNAAGGKLYLLSGSSGAGSYLGGDIVVSPGGGIGGFGRVIVQHLPTSPSGLPSGALWANSNVMTIVP